MVKNKIEICSHCGSKIIYDVHSLESGTLIKLLIKFFNGTKKGTLDANPIKIGFSQSEFKRFHSLQFFDLANKTSLVGRWRITSKGMSFLMSKIAIPPRVYSYQGQYKKPEGESIYIFQIKGLEYMKKYYEQRDRKISPEFLDFMIRDTAKKMAKEGKL